jgi:carboxymethylenebutenolidase
MKKENITLNITDGTKMQVYQVTPDGKGPFPVVIVLQEAFGVNQHIKTVAERIAAEGWLALAPELFHRTAAPGFELGYGDFELVRPHMMAVHLDGLTADLHAVHDWIQEQGNIQKNKIGSIGFCMGGRVSFIANALLPLSAAVSYYGSNMPANLAKDLHGPQLFFWGGLDMHILPENIEVVVKAVKEAGKEYINTVISYADHGFNCDARPSYQPKAAKEAWAMSMAFLKNNLQP